jgi:hypothetical protein
MIPWILIDQIGFDLQKKQKKKSPSLAEITEDLQGYEQTSSISYTNL